MADDHFADRLRQRVVGAATSPFGHAEFPLSRTMTYRGDPGLFGPGSMTWRVVGDAPVFVGAVRSLLIQAAHPEVVAGVSEHSNYREDPLGRLSRTSSYVAATSYGAMPEVRAALDAVRSAHQPVRGTSHRGKAYSAGHPAMAAWVHNVLVDSFLVAYQLHSPTPLSPSEADQFVTEQTKLGAMLGSDPLPDTAAELTDWITNHPALAGSPGMTETVRFLRNPNGLNPSVRAGYWAILDAAVASVPPNLRRILKVHAIPGGNQRGRQAVRFLRWALGPSPAWHLALLRSGADVPEGMFHGRLLPEMLDPV